MGFYYSSDLKDCADAILRDAGIQESYWIGPVQYGKDNQLIAALWFLYFNKWTLVPFVTPWDNWDSKKVDAQISRWINASEYEIQTYVKHHPMIEKRSSNLCECGAIHTRNINCHSCWCPAYKLNK